MNVTLPDDVVDATGGRIMLVVMDGLGGLPHPRTGRTELETAATPNLDRLARGAALGLHVPVQPGITPGSGPGHLSLFGYDPVRFNIGRGVLSALGVGFELEEGDVAVRLNLATVDASGLVTDRRAGRPKDAENKRLVAKLREAVSMVDDVRVFFEPEKEHRAVLVLRGSDLSADVTDTDPQEEGVAPLPVRSRSEGAGRTARILQEALDRGRAALADEPVANALLARGIDAYTRYPTIGQRFRLSGLAIARYPMYLGVARLVGMDTCPIPPTDADTVRVLAERAPQYDFLFVHFKAMDARGEDGDFDAKVKAIEAVDALMPGIEATGPDVLVVTGDHSTPSALRSHSWHPVPIMIASKWTRPSDDASFGERACQRGELGIFPAMHIMTLALAHAGRLAKFGA
jgi:2,3-bisphosphoglycerate-independent phosphoglycerate mutase